MDGTDHHVSACAPFGQPSHSGGGSVDATGALSSSVSTCAVRVDDKEAHVCCVPHLNKDERDGGQRPDWGLEEVEVVGGFGRGARR